MNMPKEVAIEQLLGNKYNPNEMSKGLFDKLKANLKQHPDRYPYVIVRPLKSGKFEIVDGHHRVKALKELGEKKVNCQVWDIDDKEAKLLMATLNSLHGEDNEAKRQVLISELSKAFGTKHDLSQFIPESRIEIQFITERFDKNQAKLKDITDKLSGSDTDIDGAIDKRFSKEAADNEAKDLKNETLSDDTVVDEDTLMPYTFMLSKSQYDLLEGALDILAEKIEGANKRGRALERLAFHYLQSSNALDTKKEQTDGHIPTDRPKRKCAKAKKG